VPALDLAAFAAVLGRGLRAAGVPVTPERSTRFVQAMTLVPPATDDWLYWSARVTFVSSPEQIAIFDRVWEALGGGALDPATNRGDPGAPPPVRAEPDRGPPVPGAREVDAAPAPAGMIVPGAERDGTDGRSRQDAVLAAASTEERLRERSFAELDRDELAALHRLMRRLALAPPPRRTRRSRPSPRGEGIDLRRTLRRSLRTDGDPLRLARRRRRQAPRRLVLLCDISGSMEPYARAFLQFLRSAVGGTSAEAFVFATRLTRLTRALRSADADIAMRRAAAAAPDWSGGTRIAEALRAFNRGHARGGMARGAVVVILSDGWERGDPRLVAREMASLRRLAHRIVWVNPRSASPMYAPLAGGMAAALPFCDAFLSGHSLAALDAVVDAIGHDRVAPPPRSAAAVSRSQSPFSSSSSTSP
jgi:uncharacterized protein with von Willebrand factor type A (vWA) domain